MSMFNEERIFFEAWLDEINRIVSFHEISDSRYYSAEEHDFWQMIVSLILAGYRVQYRADFLEGSVQVFRLASCLLLQPQSRFC